MEKIYHDNLKCRLSWDCWKASVIYQLVFVFSSKQQDKGLNFTLHFQVVIRYECSSFFFMGWFLILKFNPNIFHSFICTNVCCITDPNFACNTMCYIGWIMKYSKLFTHQIEQLKNMIIKNINITINSTNFMHQSVYKCLWAALHYVKMYTKPLWVQRKVCKIW